MIVHIDETKEAPQDPDEDLDDCEETVLIEPEHDAEPTDANELSDTLTTTAETTTTTTLINDSENQNQSFHERER